MTATRNRTVAAVAVLVLAAMLRVAALCKFHLNNDEIAEVSWARQSSKTMMANVIRDKVHPPLDYVIQHLLTLRSAGECVRRIPAVLAGIATVALVLFIGTRAFDWKAGIIAASLLSISPTHVRYSQEIRPYALGLLALTAAISALLEYRRTRLSRWALVWFSSLLLTAYTLYFAALVAAMVSAALIFLERRENLRVLWLSAPIIIGALVLLYLPWASVLFAVIKQPPFTQREQLNAAWLSYRLQVLGTGDWRVEPISIGSCLLWILAVVGCFIAWRSFSGRAVVVWLVGGLSAEILILQLHPHPSAVRHLLPAWIAMFLAIGAALSSILNVRGGAAIAAIVLAFIMAADAATLSAYYDHGRPDWREPAEFVSSRVTPRERVFAANGSAQLRFGYYWSELGTPVPLERLPSNVRITLSGPSWIVITSCPMDPFARTTLDRQELRFSSPYTNRCEIRYLREGTTIALPRGVCLAD